MRKQYFVHFSHFDYQKFDQIRILFVKNLLKIHFIQWSAWFQSNFWSKSTIFSENSQNSESVCFTMVQLWYHSDCVWCCVLDSKSKSCAIVCGIICKFVVTTTALKITAWNSKKWHLFNVILDLFQNRTTSLFKNLCFRTLLELQSIASYPFFLPFPDFLNFW